MTISIAVYSKLRLRTRTKRESNRTLKRIEVSERFRRGIFFACQRRLSFRWFSIFEIICRMTVFYVEETIRCCPWQAQTWFAFSTTWPTFDWPCCARRPPVVHGTLTWTRTECSFFHLALRVVSISDLFLRLYLDAAAFSGLVSR